MSPQFHPILILLHMISFHSHIVNKSLCKINLDIHLIQATSKKICNNIRFLKITCYLSYYTFMIILKTILGQTSPYAHSCFFRIRCITLYSLPVSGIRLPPPNAWYIRHHFWKHLIRFFSALLQISKII